MLLRIMIMLMTMVLMLMLMLSRMLPFCLVRVTLALIFMFFQCIVWPMEEGNA